MPATITVPHRNAANQPVCRNSQWAGEKGNWPSSFRWKIFLRFFHRSDVFIGPSLRVLFQRLRMMLFYRVNIHFHSPKRLSLGG
jgi:hypothetical protein